MSLVADPRTWRTEEQSARGHHIKEWLDNGRDTREVLAAQDTRRFVLCFTACESLMRIWGFDPFGALHWSNLTFIRMADASNPYPYP